MHESRAAPLALLLGGGREAALHARGRAAVHGTTGPERAGPRDRLRGRHAALIRRTTRSVQLAGLVVQTMRPQLEPDASLELEVPAAAVRAAGDADRIQQVLVNLVDNAYKHGGPGPIVVRVESGNGGVRVSVTDRGPGIARAEQQRIFEK